MPYLDGFPSKEAIAMELCSKQANIHGMMTDLFACKVDMRGMSVTGVATYEA